MMKASKALFSIVLLACAADATAQWTPKYRLAEPPACYRGEKYTVTGAPGVLVVVENRETGFHREATIASDGSYEFRGLPPGKYVFTIGGVDREVWLDYTECDIPKISRFGYPGEKIEGQTTPGTIVVIESLDKKSRVEVVADKKGNYRAKHLVPGKYTVTAGGMTREVMLRYGDYRRPSLEEQM